MQVPRRTWWSICLSALVFLIGIAGPAKAGGNLEDSGTVLQFALPAISVAATWAHDDDRGRWQFAKATALTLGLTYGMKYVIDEERPNGGFHSFPSGHTSISFNSAEFLRKRYGWAWGAPAYAVACFVGYSRIKSKQHYTGDVIAGALVGMTSSYLLTSPFENVSLEVSVADQAYKFELVFVW